MGFNFPASPSVGQTYTPGTGLPVYRWDGEKWQCLVAIGAVASAHISDTPPGSPIAGKLWWESDTGLLYIWYDDGSSQQWVLVGQFPSLTGLVRYDTAQTLTVPQKEQARSNIYAAPLDALAYSGMQINGSMEVSQENGSSSVAVTNAGKYILDGWIFQNATTAGGASGQSSTVIANGLPKTLAANTNAAATIGASNFIRFYQPIEGYRFSRLGWGTANAQPLTIGFWVLCDFAGTMSVSLVNTGTRSYCVPVSVAAGVSQYKTITIPPCPDGVWNTDNSVGCYINFVFAAGTSQIASAASTWLSANAMAAPGQTNFFPAAASIYITGVAIIPGIEAPSAERSPFIMRPYDQELLTCQRYFEIVDGIYHIFSGSVTSGNTYYKGTRFLVQKRNAPTLTGVNVAGVGFPATVGAFTSTPGGFYEGRTASATNVQGYFQTTVTADARI